MTSKRIDVELVQSLLSYDSDTGILTWKERDPISAENKMFNSRFANKEAGSVFNSSTTDIYKRIRLKIRDQRYYAHRVAWVIYTGKDIPEGYEIDHINGDATDNRIENLRLVDRKENMRNTALPINNTSGVVGVTWCKHAKKWKAQILTNKKCLYLGYYNNKEDAIEARKQAEIEQNFHENHGRKKSYGE